MRRNLFIHLTAFLCGMSIMAIELSASRLLAPVYGTSTIVWTVVIGLIMISLSIGNLLGGRFADKFTNGDRLYSLICFASIWVALIPLFGKYVLYISAVILMWLLPGNLIVGGSVISCLVIFSAPLVILGMASPYLVKLGVTDMVNNGKTTGEIYALSTIGSIIGTFIPTFLTIPTIGTSKTLFVFAAVLNLLSLYYFIFIKKRRIVRSSITAAILLALMFAPVNTSYILWDDNIVYEGDSQYNYLKVSETDDSVVLSTNVAFGVQSIYKKNNTLSGYYYDYALMAPFFKKQLVPDAKMDMLILGMGTGTYAKQCKRFFPNSSITGVEIDGKIVDLSKKYFELRDEEANVFVNDGRTFLMSTDAKEYDLIMVDAYHDITIPFHMSTKEFFTQVKEHLKPNGILVININMRSSKINEIIDYMAQTVKSVMNKVYRYDLASATNVLVFSSEDVNCLSSYIENISTLTDTHPLYNLAKEVSDGIQEITQSKLVFTDEVAPVEIMGQKVLDELIGAEASSIKKQINDSSNSLQDVFKMISGS